MKALLTGCVVLLTGCATGVQIEAGLEQTSDVRRSAASVRHAAFCNQSAAAALERYRSPEDRAAFLRICDSPAAH